MYLHIHACKERAIIQDHILILKSKITLTIIYFISLR